MNYHIVEPEVAGGVGPHTVMDRRAHPPVVTKLHYEFEVWLGDELLKGSLATSSRNEFAI